MTERGRFAAWVAVLFLGIVLTTIGVAQFVALPWGCEGRSGETVGVALHVYHDATGEMAMVRNEGDTGCRIERLLINARYVAPSLRVAAGQYVLFTVTHCVDPKRGYWRPLYEQDSAFVATGRDTRGQPFRCEGAVDLAPAHLSDKFQMNSIFDH